MSETEDRLLAEIRRKNELLDTLQEILQSDRSLDGFSFKGAIKHLINKNKELKGKVKRLEKELDKAQHEDINVSSKD